MRMLFIKRPLYEALLLHVRLLYPQEACGFIAGGGGVLHTLYVIENRLHSQTAYEMQPRQQIEALLEIEAAVHDTLVIYHSHPEGPLHLSPLDLERAFYPEAIYAIVAHPITQPRLKFFVLQQDGYGERPWQMV